MTVVVAGGGTAGVAAAVGAAEAGAKVILLERYGFWGGMATSAQVGTICGLFLRDLDGPPRWAVSGFPRRFAERLAQASSTEPITWRKGLRFLPYDPFQLRVLCDDVLAEHNVEVWLHTSVIDVHTRNHTIAGVRALAWDHPVTLQCDALIDTTGTAAATTLAGGQVIADAVHQAPAIVFGMSGVGPTEALGLNLSVMRTLRTCISAGELPTTARALSLVPGSVRPGYVLFKLGLGAGLVDTPRAISEAERRARALVLKISETLRRRLPLFNNAHLADVSAQVGVRTGRRVIGHHRLQEHHILTAQHHPEGIAYGAWPIEHWGDDPQPVMAYPPPSEACQIPAGCLESASVAGLYSAGRSLSADQRAIAAVRVIGTCLATGYAAGALAAGHALGHERSDVIQQIRGTQLPSL
jgi:hypothetical protein